MNLLGPSRHPFVGLALAVVIGIAIGDIIHPSREVLTISVFAMMLCSVVLFLRPNVTATYILVCGAFFLLHNLRTTVSPGLSLSFRLGDGPRMITAHGVVVSEPKVAETGIASFLLHLSSVELEGLTEHADATILIRGHQNVAFGDELKVFGLITSIAPPRNPGEFDMRNYLARRDVRRVLFVRYEEDGTIVRSGAGNPVLRFAQFSRRWLQTTLCRGLDDSPEIKDFISGITLGLRHQTPEDIEEPFQQTGTLHLFAVAGLHVGIVAELLWILASVTGMSRKSAALVIIPLVLFYSAVTGLHVSSVRAAVMSAVFMGGYVMDRRVFNLNSLAAAAVILLCWNTNELFATGFQLSFAVVGAIILLAAPLTNFFRRYTAPDPFLPKVLLPRSRRMADPVLLKLAGSTSVSVAAWVGSLGLLFWYFHLVTPISLVANLVVVPIAFLILAVALLSVISAPLAPWLSVVFNNTNWFLAKLVIAIVHLFAQLPAGHHYLPHPPGLGTAKARITILDLGSGGAVHLQTHRGDWLFDCGSERDYQRTVREYLHAAGVNRVNTLLLSHGDSQHIGGAERLITEIRPVILVDNPLPDRSTVHKRLRRLFHERRLTVVQPARGELVPLENELTCSVLYPPRNFSTAMSDDQALVLQIRCFDGPRILLMSDSGLLTEKTLIESGADLRSDILIKGQHHSGVSGSTEFLNAVRPQLIVATSVDFPRRERVDDQWATALQKQGIKLFRQSDTGAVEVSLWRDSWEARAYVTGEILRSSSR